MTWTEFRALVEAEIYASSVLSADELHIRYIDVSRPDNSHPSTEIQINVIGSELSVFN